MEIRNCEDYVLNELNKCQNELEMYKRFSRHGRRDFNISAFARYNVMITTTYSYVDPESYWGDNDDISFLDDESVEILENVDGGELLDRIAAQFKDRDFVGFGFNDGDISFDFYNPSGEGGTTVYRFLTEEEADEINIHK